MHLLCIISGSGEKIGAKEKKSAIVVSQLQLNYVHFSEEDFCKSTSKAVNESRWHIF